MADIDAIQPLEKQLEDKSLTMTSQELKQLADQVHAMYQNADEAGRARLRKLRVDIDSAQASNIAGRETRDQLNKLRDELIRHQPLVDGGLGATLTNFASQGSLIARENPAVASIGIIAALGAAALAVKNFAQEEGSWLTGLFFSASASVMGYLGFQGASEYFRRFREEGAKKLDDERTKQEGVTDAAVTAANGADASVRAKLATDAIAQIVIEQGQIQRLPADRQTALAARTKFLTDARQEMVKLGGTEVQAKQKEAKVKNNATEAANKTLAETLANEGGGSIDLSQADLNVRAPNLLELSQYQQLNAGGQQFQLIPSGNRRLLRAGARNFAATYVVNVAGVDVTVDLGTVLNTLWAQNVRQGGVDTRALLVIQNFGLGRGLTGPKPTIEAFAKNGSQASFILPNDLRDALAIVSAGPGPHDVNLPIYERRTDGLTTDNTDITNPSGSARFQRVVRSINFTVVP